MPTENKAINTTIPILLKERLDRECSKNGYSKSFAFKIGLFAFLEMNHTKRIAVLQKYDEFHKQQSTETR